MENIDKEKSEESPPTQHSDNSEEERRRPSGSEEEIETPDDPEEERRKPPQRLIICHRKGSYDDDSDVEMEARGMVLEHSSSMFESMTLINLNDDPITGRKKSVSLTTAYKRRSMSLRGIPGEAPFRHLDVETDRSRKSYDIPFTSSSEMYVHQDDSSSSSGEKPESHALPDDLSEKVEHHCRLQDDARRRFTRSFFLNGIIFCLVAFVVIIEIGLSVFATLRKGSSESSKADLLISSPPRDIYIVCDTESSPPRISEACREICEAAGCCWLPSSSKGNCRQAKLDICELYDTPCKAMWDNETNTETEESTGTEQNIKVSEEGSTEEVPPAPHRLAETCSSSSIATIEGLSACESTCLRAQCCFAPSKAENCRTKNFEICWGYNPCLIVSLSDAAANNSSEACASKNMLTQTGIQQCKDACVPAMCCFSQNLEQDNEICPKEDDAQWCEQFTSCSVLEVIDKIKSTTDSSVEQACGTEPCQVFSTITEKQVEDNKVTGKNSDQHPLMVKAMVDEACDEEMIAKPQNFIYCQKVCAARMCCFGDAYDTICLHGKKECDIYSACKILVDESENGSGSIEEICGIENISSNKGYGECQRLCSKRACCFLSSVSNNCYVSGLEWCDEFRVCENLFIVQPHDI